MAGHAWNQAVEWEFSEEDGRRIEETLANPAPLAIEPMQLPKADPAWLKKSAAHHPGHRRPNPMTLENWEHLPDPAPLDLRGTCCTPDEDGELTGHVAVALHVAQALEARLAQAEAERDRLTSEGCRIIIEDFDEYQRQRRVIDRLKAKVRDLLSVAKMQTVWGEDWMVAFHQAQQERDAARSQQQRAEAVLRRIERQPFHDEGFEFPWRCTECNLRWRDGEEQHWPDCSTGKARAYFTEQAANGADQHS